MTTKADTPRIIAYDVARFMAVLAMVLVNYRIVLAFGIKSDSVSVFLADAFTGRASSLFVVLAGIGLTLLDHRQVIIRRGFFLLIIGYLWQTVWSGDILHFYGWYLLAGAAALRLRPIHHFALAVLCVAIFPLAVFALDGTAMGYGQGWNWSQLEYPEFWQPLGQIRNLLLNGWHPLFPWLGFLFLGMGLGRLGLHQPGIRRSGLLIAVVVFVGAGYLSAWLQQLPDHRPIIEQLSAWWLSPDAMWATSSIPPGPLYMISASASSVAILCLLLELCANPVVARIFRPLALAGQLALSFYLAHVIFGFRDVIPASSPMNTVEGAQLEMVDQVGLRALQFGIGAVVFAVIWRRFFVHGPMEWLLRKCS